MMPVPGYYNYGVPVSVSNGPREREAADRTDRAL